MRHCAVILIAIFIFATVSKGLAETEVKVSITNKQAGALFGNSVAISNSFVIVGAQSENIGAFDRAGAAYIFRTDKQKYEQYQRIIANDCRTNDNFGWSVDISGNFLIVGAYREAPNDRDITGSAYIFEYSNASWTQHSKIFASDKQTDDYFGWSVSISDEHFVFGARYENAGGIGDAGSAYIYNLNYDLSFPRDKYVMFGIPVTVSNGDANELFRDDFNNQDAGSETWRISQWSVANQEYARYSEDGSGDPPDFVPGLGYWMVQDVVDDCIIDIVANQENGHVPQDQRYVKSLESRDGENRGVNNSFKFVEILPVLNQ